MKNIFLTAALIFWSATTFVQTVFERTITEKITTVEGQKTAYEYTALANDFDKIATKDSNNWLPYYYAAFATIQKGRLLMQSRKTVELYAVAADEEK